MQAKLKANQPLTSEERHAKLLCEHDALAAPRELLLTDAYGNVTHHRTMQVDHIIEGVKTAVDNTVHSKRGKYLGSIDPLTALNWSKECGAAIGTKEFAIYARRKLMSPEFAKYRAATYRTMKV